MRLCYHAFLYLTPGTSLFFFPQWQLSALDMNYFPNTKSNCSKCAVKLLVEVITPELQNAEIFIAIFPTART